MKEIKRKGDKKMERRRLRALYAQRDRDEQRCRKREMG